MLDNDTDAQQAAFRAWMERFHGAPPYIEWGEYDAKQIHCIREALRVAFAAGVLWAQEAGRGERQGK